MNIAMTATTGTAITSIHVGTRRNPRTDLAAWLSRMVRWSRSSPPLSPRPASVCPPWYQGRRAYRWSQSKVLASGGDSRPLDLDDDGTDHSSREGTWRSMSPPEQRERAMTRSKRVTFLARVAVVPLAALTLAGYGAGAAGA